MKAHTRTTDALLHHLLGCPLEAIARPSTDFNDWRRMWDDVCRRWRLPIDRCIAAGLHCDRLAWAFAAGYQGALQQLYPDLTRGAIAAICISESGGNHPQAIRTRLTRTHDDGRLNGEKEFITGGENAQRLIVAASIGMADGRNRLRMVLVDRGTAGVTLAPMPALPFIPEIGHATARFHDVHIPSDHVLPGDGYLGAVKPFRTIEDLHVTGAMLGHLLGIARRSNWPHGILCQLSVLVVALGGLAREDPLSPATHVAMGGLFDRIDALLAAMDPLWPQTDAHIARRWQRDKPVLKIADKVRQLRLDAARRHYGI